MPGERARPWRKVQEKTASRPQDSQTLTQTVVNIGPGYMLHDVGHDDYIERIRTKRQFLCVPDKKFNIANRFAGNQVSGARDESGVLVYTSCVSGALLRKIPSLAAKAATDV